MFNGDVVTSNNNVIGRRHAARPKTDRCPDRKSGVCLSLMAVLVKPSNSAIHIFPVRWMLIHEWMYQDRLSTSVFSELRIPGMQNAIHPYIAI